MFARLCSRLSTWWSILKYCVSFWSMSTRLFLRLTSASTARNRAVLEHVRTSSLHILVGKEKLTVIMTCCWHPARVGFLATEATQMLLHVYLVVVKARNSDSKWLSDCMHSKSRAEPWIVAQHIVIIPLPFHLLSSGDQTRQWKSPFTGGFPPTTPVLEDFWLPCLIILYIYYSV